MTPLSSKSIRNGESESKQNLSLRAMISKRNTASFVDIRMRLKTPEIHKKYDYLKTYVHAGGEV